MKKYLYLMILFTLPAMIAAESSPRATILNGTYIGEFSRNRVNVVNQRRGIQVSDGCISRLFRANRRGVLTDRSGRRTLLVLAPGVIEIRNGNRNSEVYVKRGHRYRDTPRFNNRPSVNIEGRWTNDRLRRIMDIQFTRDGIRARDIDDRNWINYTASRNNPNEFIDRRGNIILIESRQRLTWIGFRGREISFRRR